MATVTLPGHADTQREGCPCEALVSDVDSTIAEVHGHQKQGAA